MTYNIRDDNGTLLGTVDADTNGNLVIEHAQSGEQARLNNNGLDVSSLSTEQANNIHFVSGGSGIQSAINDATDGDWVVVEDVATYQEQVTVDKGIKLLANNVSESKPSDSVAASIDGTDGVALEITASAIIEGFLLTNDGSGPNICEVKADAVAVRNCFADNGGGNGFAVIDSIDSELIRGKINTTGGDGVNLDANTERCLVDSVIDRGPGIVDNGTGNVVRDTR